MNDAPVASSGSFATAEDTAFQEPPRRHRCRRRCAHLCRRLHRTGPWHGLVNSDGSFTYTPTANFNGSEATYAVSDGTATVERTMTVTVTP